MIREEYLMKNKIRALLFVSFLLVSFSFGCIFPGSENNSSEMLGNASNSSENPDSNPTTNVSSSIPDNPNLAQMIQMSEIIAECTVVDIVIGEINLNEMGMPYQRVNVTLKVNEVILKQNQDIGVGDEIVINRLGVPNFNIGDRAILIELADSLRFGYPRDTLLIQEGEIYSGSSYQISLEDMKTFAQKSDDYYEKYKHAFNSDDIVVAKILTNTDVNKMEYTMHDDLPHQTHKVKVIYSASGKFTGNTELNYVIWYFPKKILPEIDNNPRYLHESEGWIETSDGYYRPSRWDPESSFLKKHDYYIIYVGTGYTIYGEMVPTPSKLEYIEKYDSKTKKELKEFIEEYHEIYELVQKYETRR